MEVLLVLVGAALALTGGLVVEVRRERLARRAAARLVRDELEGLAQSMRDTAERGHWWMIDDQVSIREWEANKAQLAAALGSTDWLLVNSSYRFVYSFARDYESAKAHHTPTRDAIFPPADEHTRSVLKTQADMIDHSVQRLTRAADYRPVDERISRAWFFLRADIRKWLARLANAWRRRRRRASDDESTADNEDASAR
jgi:hypothetical protein